MCGKRLRRFPALVCALLAATLGGCLGTKAYLDPTLPKASAADLVQNGRPAPVCLTVDFRTYGKPNLGATGQLYSQVAATLRASKLFSDVVAGGADSMDRIDIQMNNSGDIGSAVAKGVGTGLTFGLVGSTVVDRYEFAATFRTQGKESVTKEYRHAIISTVGNKRGPPGLKPMTVQQAFDQVVQDLVFTLLRDLQKEGHLSAASEPRGEPRSSLKTDWFLRLFCERWPSPFLQLELGPLRATWET